MSSILEALKKLEADKNAQLSDVMVPETAYSPEKMSSALLGNFAEATPAAHRLSPVALVLGGGLFTVLLIGVSVLLALFLVRTMQSQALTADPARTVAAANASAAELPATDSVAPDGFAIDASQPQAPDAGATAAPAPPEPREVPAPRASRPRPQPRAEETAMVVTPVPVAAEVRYEPYIPKPAGETARESAPLPKDLRSLPMLSRDERAQYGLEAISINMLNEASPTRPLGNALINLEKIFIGETLPGSNAKLVDVKSHGIAVEIMSTRQRYYIPRGL